MGKASDNIFPKVQMSTAIASTAPSGGTWRMEARADGIYAVSSNTGSAGTGPFSAGSAGSVATDAIWDAAGDLVQGTGANTAARLAIGAAGTVVRSTGTTNAYALPPGHEYDYVQITAPVTITNVTEATAVTVVTANAFAGDGSTTIMVEFYSDGVYSAAIAGVDLSLYLYDGSASIGVIGIVRSETTQRGYIPFHVTRRLTPSNASHTYSIRGSTTGSTGAVGAGAGGSGTEMPAYIRITRV